MTYIVIEIQTNTDGTVGTLITAHSTRNEAEQKYHLILSSAAVSTLPTHAAVLMTNDGKQIYSQSYSHPVASSAEVTD